MTRFKDISGQKFGRLTALYRLHKYHKKGTYWLCACECGNLVETTLNNLTMGHTKSCGCLNHDNLLKRNTTHGKANTKLYDVWLHMKSRCYNVNNKDYKHYGGRGIVVCDEWKDNFQAFYDWCINNGYKDNLTIDRVDVNENYNPNNCRFADRKQQSRNRRNIKLYTINGETHCLSEWCEIYNLKFHTIQARLIRGWSIEKALELEV